jgi:hypothetical protein
LVNPGFELIATTFELIVGLALLVWGVIGTLQKRSSFGLGSKTGGPASRDFTITLTESRAVFFSRICIVEGGIIVALWLLAYMGDMILRRWLGFVAGAGLVIALLVFAGCAFFELSEPLIAKDKKNKKKKNSE